MFRPDRQLVSIPLDCKRRHRLFPVPDDLAGPILEYLCRIVLHPQQARAENREAGARTAHHCLGPGNRGERRSEVSGDLGHFRFLATLVTASRALSRPWDLSPK